MPAYQKLIVVGNVGQPPELRYTPAGKAVCGFSVAVNDKYTNNAGEKVESTTWFRVEAWDKQAEICNQYLKKGSLVLVEGVLKSDKTSGGPVVYEKKGGGSGANFEIRSSSVRFLSSVEKQEQPEQQEF